MVNGSRPVEAVVFDLDGTLADTLTLIVRAFNAAFGKHVGQELSWEEVEALFGPPEEVIAVNAVGEEGAGAFLRTYRDYYAANHARLVKPIPGVSELLTDLKAVGFRLALYTGKGARTNSITLEALGLAQHFDVIVTGNDVTRYKPAPDGVLLACRRLSVSPAEAVYVGDSPMDVEAGRAAGTLTAGVTWANGWGRLVGEARPDLLFANVQAFREWIFA